MGALHRAEGENLPHPRPEALRRGGDDPAVAAVRRDPYWARLQGAVPLVGGALGQGLRGVATGPGLRWAEPEGAGPREAARLPWGGVCAGRSLHKGARRAGSGSLSVPSMVVGVPAARGLLLLPPLLQLPQVGRRRSARAPRGGCELGAPLPGLTPVPTGGAGLRRRQLRPLGPVSQGGGSRGLAPPCREARAGPSTLLVPPPAPGAAVPAGAHPRPAGAACGTWGKWRPRRRAGSDGSPLAGPTRPRTLSAESPGPPALGTRAASLPRGPCPDPGQLWAHRPLAGLPFIACFPPPPSSPLQEAPLSAVIGLGTGLCRWPGTVCPGSEPKALVASPGDSQDRPSSKRPGGASSSGPALAW